jgi:hypothetical protein
MWMVNGRTRVVYYSIVGDKTVHIETLGDPATLQDSPS